MFYAHFVLAKKGPLARIWLAAHWDKKLTKAHVFETNIESSVEGILQPKVKMALRTSGHLLLGIVRIFSRKAKYLLADCNEAFIKIKMAFRPGVVDLPEAAREAAVATITLPEVFHDFDSAMPDITIDIDEQVTLNQSRAEDITLKEDYGNLTLMADDGFDDIAFDEAESNRDATNMEEGFENATMLLGEQCKERPEESSNQVNVSSTSTKPNASLSTSLTDDGFGGTVGEGLLDGETGGLFEPAGLFDDAPLDNVALENSEQTEEPVVPPVEKPPEKPDEDSDDDMYDAPMSMGAPSPPSSPESENAEKPTESDVPSLVQNNSQNENTILDVNPPERTPMEPPDTPADILPPPPEVPQMPPPAMDHTTLINNEDESFALAPLDTTIVQGAERTVKAKRKRKLIVDEVKNISGEEMKSQLSDTTDIVTTLDLAPPTKRLMHWKETGGVEKLFALPGYPILSSRLSRAYQRHLTTRSVDNEDFGTEDDLHIDLDADVEQAREKDDSEINVSRKRPRRGDVTPIYHQELPPHLDSFNIDSSRPSYASDHNMSHSSLPNFFPQQMIGNVMQHPPPPHMIQQVLQTSVPDVNQLGPLPDMMHHSMVDQNAPMHTISSNMHNVSNIPSPIVADAFNHRLVHSGMEPEHSHLLPSAVPDQMQQTSMDKQLSNHPLGVNDINQQLLQDQLSQPNAVTNLIENNLHPCSEGNEIMQPHMDGQVMQPPIDEEVTQPVLSEDYAHAVQPLSDSLSTTVMLPNNEEIHNDSQVVSDHRNESDAQNCVSQPQPELPQAVNQTPTDLFDTLHNGDAFGLTQNDSNNNNNNNNQLPQNDNAISQKMDFPLSEDDDDDYGAPGSVGPALPEEQMADETYEQFEERILSKRTTHMLHIINSRLDQDGHVNFADVVRNNKRKQVAQKFYTFLVLKKQQAIELEQTSSYGDLIITKGPKFNTVYNSN